MKKQSFDLAKMQVQQLSNDEMLNYDGGWGFTNWIKKHWGDTLRCAGGTAGGGIVGGVTTAGPWGVVGGGLVGAASSCHF